MKKNISRQSRTRLRSLDDRQLATVSGGVWRSPLINDGGCIPDYPVPEPYPLPSPYPIPIW